jgi:hypothetical protein
MHLSGAQRLQDVSAQRAQRAGRAATTTPWLCFCIKKAALGGLDSDHSKNHHIMRLGAL